MMVVQKSMKAHVYVNLKKTVLDPQGQTILQALHGLGFQGVSSVRQGKCFELELAPDLTPEQVRAEVERIAKDVLTNPVIEEYVLRLDASEPLSSAAPDAAVAQPQREHDA
jgi:phosphoribosylformylglycinamidine synthase PurS subunit